MRNNQHHGHNQNKRMRGRNRGGGGKNHNPLTRVYESNGPDVKIRGTANHVAEKYIQLARDATASGDPVAAENYYQHAEHYFRLIAAAQEQFRQNQPYQPRPEGGEQQPRVGEENFEDGEEEIAAPQSGGSEPHYPREQQQPYPQQGQQGNQQPYPPRDYQNQNRQPDNRPQQQGGDNDLGRLPSFITGGQPQPGYGQNGGYDNQGDRFPLHRRRRRGHRGPRPDMQGGSGQPNMGNDGGDDLPPATGPAGE